MEIAVLGGGHGHFQGSREAVPVVGVQLRGAGSEGTAAHLLDTTIQRSTKGTAFPQPAFFKEQLFNFRTQAPLPCYY